MTEEPGMLQSMGLQSQTRLSNWTTAATFLSLSFLACKMGQIITHSIIVRSWETMYTKLENAKQTLAISTIRHGKALWTHLKYSMNECVGWWSWRLIHSGNRGQGLLLAWPHFRCWSNQRWVTGVSGCREKWWWGGENGEGEIYLRSTYVQWFIEDFLKT